MHAGHISGNLSAPVLPWQARNDWPQNNILVVFWGGRGAAHDTDDVIKIRGTEEKRWLKPRKKKSKERKS